MAVAVQVKSLEVPEAVWTFKATVFFTVRVEVPARWTVFLERGRLVR